MKTLVSIDGMSCKNCVKHVKEALEELAGVSEVSVDLGAGNALVEHDGVSADILRDSVEDAGYDVTGVSNVD